MKKPNLFILGAPKCGTTSLAYWLSNHPEIYLPALKEPHYFSTDIRRKDRISSAEYLNLYNDAPQATKWWIDASTRYLYSEVALKNIIEFNPNSKFIILLRNPADMLYSLHNHLVFLGGEKISDFEKAWLESKDRKKGFIDEDDSDPDSLSYREIALFGQQIERVLSLVSQGTVKVYDLDELKENPQSVADDVFNFLELDSVKINAQIKNKSMAHRSVSLAWMVKKVGKIKEMLGVTKGVGVLNALSKVNRKDYERTELPNRLRHEILFFFRNDIALLSEILDRDLGYFFNDEQ